MAEPRVPIGHRLLDLAGAIMLGVATIFVPKARPDDHWSTSPRAEVHEESASEASGPPRRRRRRRA
ncbi:MAG TPA: hypothetical protein VF228_17680 [Iamia sp.]